MIQDKPKNSIDQIIKHYTYNGDMLSICLLIEIVIMMIIIFAIPDTPKGNNIKLALFCGVVIAFFEMFKYTLSRVYNGRVIIARKLGKIYINQRSDVKFIPNADCAIDSLDDELLDVVRKLVIKKRKTVYLTTHYHVIKLYEQLSDDVEVIYDPNDFMQMSLSRDKKGLIRKCNQCSRCKDRQTCKLHKDQTVKMYNLKIKPKEKTAR